MAKKSTDLFFDGCVKEFVPSPQETGGRHPVRHRPGGITGLKGAPAIDFSWRGAIVSALRLSPELLTSILPERLPMNQNTIGNSLSARVLARLSLLALFAWLSAAPLAAQSGLTVQDVARMRNVSAAAISPDGQSIAYVLSVPRDPMREDDGANWSELHVIGRDARSRPYVAGQTSVSSISWTPDGKGIAFLARRPGDRATALYAIPADGGEARRVVAAETSISAYTFCPHMQHVAWTAQEPLPDARRLAERGFNQDVYEENLRAVRLWVADLDSSGVAGKPRMFALPGSAGAIEWNPAGGQIAVTLAPTPLVDDEYMNRKIHIVDEHEGKIIARLDLPGKFGEFAWSPDGKNIAVISAEDRSDPQQGRLWVFPAAGGKPRDLLPNYQGHVSAIAWQGNDTVMFVGDERVGTVVAEVSLAGERKTLFPAGELVFTGLSLSSDGQSAAFLCQTPSFPAEVCAGRHGDTSAKRLTDSNPWLAQRRLAKQETVKYKARDGLELEGLLIRPLDEKPGARYPLILVVHGGPEAHFRSAWLTSYSNPGQVAAARGFAVFYPNYRGSTGRGVAFSKLSQSDPAGKEFDDCVDGVDHLIQAGLVEKSKVGITGGSYGGYATAWGATFYSSRFAAGVMFVGISDKIAKFGTTDIPQEESLVHALHYPWENWQKFLERSPIYHAQKHRTPLLILGGMDDPRVHPTQSMILYRYLKTLNQAPVRWVRYPGEQHGNRRAASRLDYHLRLMQWMEHYLQGPGGAPPPPEIEYAGPR
jgi:dipeptidyl aminopeptidase/acylaminoacyl peptidase